MKIIDVKNLTTSFFTHLGEVQAVRGVSFSLDKGEILGIVGESGSGKSVTSMSIMGLVDKPGRITNGKILFDQKDLVKLSDHELSDIRGKQIGMIFQDPMTALNPVFKIGNQIVEVIRRHSDLDKKEARKKAIELLKLVGIPEPETRIDQYPHQFSGGMRQRALIAMAISSNPELLIADEPTTALDVTIQAQILQLISELKDKIGLSVILITHDLGVISEICDKVIVMYGGMKMEEGSVIDIFDHPQHPYTKGLHRSIPKDVTGDKSRLVPIPGSPPDLLNPPKGCPFAPRCPHTMAICMEEAAPLFKISDTQCASCWLHQKDAPQVEDYVKTEEVVHNE